jgi:hypothetical protein
VLSPFAIHTMIYATNSNEFDIKRLRTKKASKKLEEQLKEYENSV